MAIQLTQTVKIFLVLLGVLFVGVLIGVALVDLGYIPAGEKQLAGLADRQSQAEEIQVDLAIDYGNGQVQSFPGEALQVGDKVLQLLESLERTKGIAVEKRDFPGMGVFIEAIQGVHNTNSSYWQFWVNGKYSQRGADQYELQDGDKVLWKRTSERPE